MWDWYTGVIIWKTQNPWTAMRGQMYDYYLDPNACLYGLRTGSKPLNVMCNPVDGMVMIANNDFKPQRNLMLVIKTYDIAGKEKLFTSIFAYVGPSSIQKISSVKKTLEAFAKDHGGFLHLELLDENQKSLCENLYWFPDDKGMYSGLNMMKKVTPAVTTRQLEKGKIEVTMSNAAGNPVAFFNRLSLLDPKTGKRLLPVFYSDNYVSVLPGKSTKVIMDYTPETGAGLPLLSVKGWNVDEQKITIR